MNRRSFFAKLACLPIISKLVKPKPVVESDFQLFEISWTPQGEVDKLGSFDKWIFPAIKNMSECQDLDCLGIQLVNTAAKSHPSSVDVSSS